MADGPTGNGGLGLDKPHHASATLSQTRKQHHMSTPHIITLKLPKLPTNAKLSAIAIQSARNLISLFADHENEIQEAITESDDAKTTFGHSIILDLGKHKQIDKLSFSIKRGDEITMSIPDPDQPDLFDDLNPRDLRYGRQAAGATVVDAEVVPMGPPAPMAALPSPDHEDEATQLSDLDISNFLVALEGGPKMQRKKRLGEFLAQHGPAEFRRLSEYRHWNEPDPHLEKLIAKMIDELPAAKTCMEDDENLTDRVPDADEEE